MSNLTIAKLSKESTKGFIEKVKDRYVEKYADDMLQLMDDQKRLQKNLDKLNAWIKRVEEGDILAIEEYKKARRKMVNEGDAEF